MPCRSFHPISPNLPSSTGIPSTWDIKTLTEFSFRITQLTFGNSKHCTITSNNSCKGDYNGFFGTVKNKTMRDKGQTNVYIKKLSAHLFIRIENYWCDQSKFCTHSNTNVNIVVSKIRFYMKVIILNPNRTFPLLPLPLPTPPFPPHRLDKGREIISFKFITLLNLLSDEIRHPRRVCFWNLFRGQSTGL